MDKRGAKVNKFKRFVRVQRNIQEMAASGRTVPQWMLKNLARAEHAARLEVNGPRRRHSGNKANRDGKKAK